MYIYYIAHNGRSERFHVSYDDFKKFNVNIIITPVLPINTTKLSLIIGIGIGIYNIIILKLSLIIGIYIIY